MRADFTAHVPNGILQLGAVLEQEKYNVKLIDPLFQDWNISIL